MLKNAKIKHFLPYLAGFLLMGIISLWFFVFSYSNTNIASAWDGSVAESFSGGNGSPENPYLINSGSELAYLKSLLEGNEAVLYADKSYKLTKALNLGENEFYIENNIAFSGMLDGDAYTIYNGNITGSLFASLEGATIKSINFSNVTLNNTSERIAGLLASDSSNSNFENITISLNYNLEVNNHAGVLIGNDDGSNFRNIVLNADYNIDESFTSNLAALIYNATNSELNNILVNETDLNLEYFINSTALIIGNVIDYTTQNGEFVLASSNIDAVLDTFISSSVYEYKVVNSEILFVKKITSFAPMRIIIQASDTVEFAPNYNNTCDTYSIPNAGYYKLETWGAQGGGDLTWAGHGGYSAGTVYLSAGTTLYICVGEAGKGGTGNGNVLEGGFNGGGNTYPELDGNNGSGGGATDVRIGSNSLYARVIVAGGGGGAVGAPTGVQKGHGGGIAGIGGTNTYGGGCTALGGTGSAGGTGSQCGGPSASNAGFNGSFGQGGNGQSGGNYNRAGGGGGWYGGGSTFIMGGGGSGFVYSASTSGNTPGGYLLNSAYYMSNTASVDGGNQVPTIDGLSTMTGKTGDGFAKITYVGASLPVHVIDEHPSGLDGNILHVNNLVDDYNYYIGKNFVDSNNGVLPSGMNQELYNDTNLVRVKLTYSGVQSLNGTTYTGRISATETQNTVIYYDYAPVVNGKVKIELIDNPFTNRPTDRGFNNWVVDGTDGTISQNLELHKRELEVPVTYTDGIPNDIDIALHASWVEAQAYVKNTSTATSNSTVGSWAYIFNRLYAKGIRALTAATMYNGQSMAGYFVRATLSNGTSLNGYYNSTGQLLTSGTSTSTSTVYYRLIQSYDADRTYNSSTTYYYNVTRDTNIIHLTGNFTTSTAPTGTNAIANNWTSATAGTKPFTFTGLHNGTDYSNTYTWTVSTYIMLYNDVTIENMRISCGTGDSIANLPGNATTVRSIYGNNFNLKLGRGIIRSGSNRTFTNVLGGNASTVGTSSAPKKYTLMIESGFYNNIFLVGVNSTASNAYVNMNSVYGNDYDRITGNNAKLDNYFIASGARGANVMSTNTYDVAINSVVKSGTFGSSKSDYTTGIYIGGLTGGTHSAIRQIKVEGGSIYNLIGGPLSNTNRAQLKDIQIFQTGGEIDMIVGGAGRSATYGHRVLSLTGGRVNYSVFGGSNSYTAQEATDGRLNGSGFIYVGGNAQIGNQTYVNNNSQMWNAEAGSVFGIGNGRTGVDLGGSNDNSHVIIDGNARVLRNVYGGGNFGAVGAVTSLGSTVTNIHILGGQVNGDVYGGGNQNGSGVSNILSTVTINMLGGTVSGSVYGGSNVSGTVYGTTNLNITGGRINTSIYGGGKGQNTYVSRNVNVNVGTNSSGPTVNRNVYGGSALGVVNSTAKNATVTAYLTNVTVNSGTINGAVFGGGEGSTSYTPYVAGNIVVNINNGNIVEVYGGNDQAGTPNGTVNVYLKGGVIGESYGGGNRSSVTNTNIYLQGAQTTYLFGGSNVSGNVTSSNVVVTSGTAGTVYGGNNVGGSLATSNVYLNGGTIEAAIYGGGNMVATATTNLYLNSSANAVPLAFGGGKSASVTTANVKQQGATITSLFGGSNMSGTVLTSKVTHTSGTTTNVYGGNNQGGDTVNANLTIDAGTIGTIYGGGNQAVTSSSLTNINNGTITNVFGGGNEAGINTSRVNINGGTITNVYGGSNASGTVNNTSVYVQSASASIASLYGGNNAGGQTLNPYILITAGNVNSIYGGGNLAITNASNVEIQGGELGTIYAGGNEAGITTNTLLKITGGNISANAYGGGNYGIVSGNTEVLVTAGTILGSVYAGGNGATAVVYGNTNVSVGGEPTIGSTTSVAPHYGSVFGGGNAAPTGTAGNNNSKATVNIAGGSIYGNVYGGANTSVVYGTTDVNIGRNTISNLALPAGNVYIKGTIFGGGEANASGSEIFDYSFISVTSGITVDIDASNHASFAMHGSIFGSGNASSTTGVSKINIKDYGTFNEPQKNISIQRTDILTVDNSNIVLSGATDRTNEYSDVLFTLSIISNLKLQNNSSLFLETGANLLKRYESLTSGGAYATVNINDNTKAVNSNVVNRIYLLEGKNLNIAINESVTAFGEVYGMTFFGMYQYNHNGTVNTGIYNPNYAYGDDLNWGDMPSKGSYVLGQHKVNHDIGIDGFYSNFMDEDTGKNKVAVISPTPEDSEFYMWIIGEAVIEYNLDLVASKYSTLGTAELTFLEFSDPNTSFLIMGFDDSELDESISLVNSANIPRTAPSSIIADNVFGLSVKSGNSGWLNKGETEFLTSSPNITGTTTYVGENTTSVPSLLFYLYHSKNLSEEKELGTVRITVMAVTKVDALTSVTERLIINVNMSTALYQTNEYEASMTPGREYKMFTSTVVNIASRSSLSTYYSLFAEDQNVYRPDYHRVLVSNYVMPVGTKITMIDFVNEVPTYYSYIVSQANYNAMVTYFNQHHEAVYNFSDFVKMGTVSANSFYDNTQMNNQYYTNGNSSEEFIFIVDFDEAGIQSNLLEKSLLIELRDSGNQTLISVLGIQHLNMNYNVYASVDAQIALSGNITPNTLYIGENAELSVNTNFANSKIGNVMVHDTRYFDSKLGIKISLLDSNGNLVPGTSMMGVFFEIEEVAYYPDIDGTTRIKVADRVGSISSWLTMNTQNANLPTGNYTLKIESFGSPDGIFYGDTSAGVLNLSLHIINDIYGLNATIDENMVIIDGVTGFNQNKDNNLKFNIGYSSGLANPNLRVSLYRRKYDTIYSSEYTLVDLQDYLTDELTLSNNPLEYLITSEPVNNYEVDVNTKNQLLTGTYKVEIKLYDGNVFIGKISKSFIIK